MTEINAVRKANAELIRKFFAPESRMPGGAKYRASLFAEDGLKQQCYPISDCFPWEPPYENAREILLNQPDVNVGLNLDAVIYVTSDPSVIWAETEEYGEVEVCGKKGPFHGHSNHIFHILDGKIVKWRFFPNEYTIRDTLEMPFMKLPRFDYDEGCMQDFLTTRNPMRLVDAVEYDLTGGMKTRIRMMDEYQDSVTDEIRRHENAQTILRYFGEYVTNSGNCNPNGYQFRTSLYHQDGYTVVPYPHQDPTAELPNLFWEHHMPHGTPDPDLEFYIDRLYCTGDPDVFWCENKSNGWHPTGLNGEILSGYWNHYTQYFRIKEGQIYLMREFYDPYKERLIKGTDDVDLPQEATDFYRWL